MHLALVANENKLQAVPKKVTRWIFSSTWSSHLLPRPSSLLSICRLQIWVQTIYRHFRHIKRLYLGSWTRRICSTIIIEHPRAQQSIRKQRDGTSILSGGMFYTVSEDVPCLKSDYQMRFYTWRKLWLHLAIAEKELGLPIPDQAITEMEANLVRTLPSLCHIVSQCSFLSTLMRSSLH